ncbi:MFS transporter [Vulcaniibacterium tengchongense]|uniref:DHA1 family inner membrane transport protein n=1 Tax=Vulcaniibacterium tengchongense TaxID=1273429 RepID=A0A3N4VAE7_9GAMM|nr:MFS transporter [Vulcaniibacterium tengchongense]RPE79962.1 DHA1 family inner membrane transport protein [Vulcaniibacterium tengchongense]
MTAHAQASLASSPPPALSPRQVTLILFALAMGGFAIGTSEFVVMGLISEIARGLGVNEPQVGHVVSAYALGVVVGAPLLAILGAKLSRRSLLLALMGFYAFGNLASALAPGYPTLMLARFVAGLPHGAYFGVAALVAARISPPEQRGTAVGRVMLGLSISLLVGNPLATWLGQHFGWRWAFAIVSVIALATVAMTARVLPRVNAPRPDALRELRDFNRKPVWLALGIGAIGFAGMFCVFSYLAPTLVQVTGVRESFVPFGLVAFGLGGILGTLAGGWLFDRLQFRAAAVVLGWSALVLLLFPLAARSVWTVLPAVLAVGTMGALAPILQAHLMDVAAEAQTLAAASNHSAFNTANALGPWLGGMAITAGYGWTSTGVVGAATAIAGLLVYFWARREAQARAVLAVECE